MSRKKTYLSLIFSGLPERIRKIRGGLTQTEFGKIIRVKQATVYKYEKGLALPGEDVLNRIADHGGITVEWLLGDHELLIEEEQTSFSKPEPGIPGPDAPYLFSAVDTSVLTQIIAVLEDILKKKKKELKPARKAHFISLLYDHFQETGKPPDRAAIEEFLMQPLFKDW